MFRNADDTDHKNSENRMPFESLRGGKTGGSVAQDTNHDGVISKDEFASWLENCYGTYLYIAFYSVGLPTRVAGRAKFSSTQTELRTIGVA